MKKNFCLLFKENSQRRCLVIVVDEVDHGSSFLGGSFNHFNTLEYSCIKISKICWFKWTGELILLVLENCAHNLATFFEM